MDRLKRNRSVVLESGSIVSGVVVAELTSGNVRQTASADDDWGFQRASNRNI